MHYTILIPARGQAGAIGQQVAEICALFEQRQALFEQRQAYFEVLCVADRNSASLKFWHGLASRHAPLRVMEAGSCGTSAALALGIEAARGDVVIAIEAGRQYLPEQIPWLLARLSRADMVVGRRQRPRLRKSWLALRLLPRQLLFGVDSRDPDCLFWAARREAVQTISLSEGMHRYLPSLVSMRGFRVGEIYIDHRRHERRLWNWESRPRPLLLLRAWWQQRCNPPWRDNNQDVPCADDVQRRLDPAQPLTSAPHASHIEATSLERR